MSQTISARISNDPFQPLNPLFPAAGAVGGAGGLVPWYVW